MTQGCFSVMFCRLRNMLLFGSLSLLLRCLSFNCIRELFPEPPTYMFLLCTDIVKAMVSRTCLIIAHQCSVVTQRVNFDSCAAVDVGVTSEINVQHKMRNHLLGKITHTLRHITLNWLKSSYSRSIEAFILWRSCIDGE